MQYTSACVVEYDRLHIVTVIGYKSTRTSNLQTETAVERLQHHRPLFRGGCMPPLYPPVGLPGLFDCRATWVAGPMGSLVHCVVRQRDDWLVHLR